MPGSSWSIDGATATGVDPSDRGLAYGDGLFETMLASEGVIRWLDYHLERLAEGCERLRMPALAQDELRDRIAAQTPASGLAIVKLIVTRGSGARGYRPPPKPRPMVLIGAQPLPPAGDDAAVALVTCSLRLAENPKLAGLKHLCRLEQVLAQLELAERGVDEGLLLSSNGHVVGGTSHNVFGVFGSCVRTPRLDRCGVRGVMRRVVLETCAALNLTHEEAEMNLETLLRADELFVTNAVRGIRPVVSLDGTAFAAGAVTQRIRAHIGTAAHV